jgi:hypothetical protein
MGVIHDPKLLLLLVFCSAQKSEFTYLYCRMQESWTFEFPYATVNQDSLDELFTEQQRELGIFLSYTYKGAVVEQVRLLGSIQSKDGLSGTLQVIYALVYFNACLDINEQQEAKMNLEFSLDLIKKKLLLRTEYVPSRHLDDI